MKIQMIVWIGIVYFFRVEKNTLLGLLFFCISGFESHAGEDTFGIQVFRLYLANMHLKVAFKDTFLFIGRIGRAKVKQYCTEGNAM